jgi:hypothetical protein
MFSQVSRLPARITSIGLIAMLAIAAIAAFAFNSQAAEARRPSGTWEAHTWGRPYNLEAGSDGGWYFWTDGDGLHVRSTTPSDDAHRLSAVIRTNGRFYDVDQVRTEFRDLMVVSDHEIIVFFKTADGIDGVDFRIAGGSTVQLAFFAGGNLIPESHIYVGLTAHHPGNNPFDIDRAP